MGFGSGAVRSLLDRRETGKEIEGNRLYFYYRAGKMWSGKRMLCRCEAEPLGPFVAGILSFGNTAPPCGQMTLDL